MPHQPNSIRGSSARPAAGGVLTEARPTRPTRGPGKPAWIAALALIASAAGIAPPVRADDQPPYEKLVAAKAPAFVAVKFVLKTQSRFGSRESESEASGIMIDPQGLVLCSNSSIGGLRFGSATPTNIKVLIGKDTEGLEASFLARDSELDLAWIRIKEPGETPFAFLNLSESATPQVGRRLLAIRRMSKYFDRAVLVSEGLLSGTTQKPRDLLIPSGSLDLQPGLPVFTAEGSVVGVVVIQMPGEDEMEGGYRSMQGLGRDVMGGLILPAAEVLKATNRAKQAAEEDDEEETTSAPGDEDREEE